MYTSNKRDKNGRIKPPIYTSPSLENSWGINYLFIYVFIYLYFWRCPSQASDSGWGTILNAIMINDKCKGQRLLLESHDIYEGYTKSFRFMFSQYSQVILIKKCTE